MTARLFCLRLWRLLLAGGLAMAMLASCGGGGIAGIGSGGTGSFAFGPIAAFGSIIVGGTRYEDREAQVLGDDGEPLSRSELALGMVVEVNGSPLAAAPAGQPYVREGRAETVRVATVVVGPLQAVDALAGTLTVFGQRVAVNAGTVFGPDLAGGLPALAALPAGTALEVHGFVDAAASGRITATRVARASAAAAFRLRGIVQDLDTGSRTFRIGQARLSYAGLEQAAQQAGLANGVLLRVRAMRTALPGGSFQLDQIGSGQRQIEDRDDVEVEGRITRFASPFDFDVEGIPVDARQAEFDEDPARLALGVRVEVEGRIRNGVLIAEEVDIEDDDQDPTGTVELEGRIASLDRAARTFRLGDYLVRYGAQTAFDDGSEADLADGVAVEVEGRIVAPGVIDALVIEFDD